ncbi:glutamate racemase [Humisphaera borealis]|uniref:Glutamate racemase n=1 Tax=Humisphaera borealis TaxID=2807512 RepID=A0A7M2WSJ4_9BACT|nr:glutamate racemase [Humisphaera borealis]
MVISLESHIHLAGAAVERPPSRTELEAPIVVLDSGLGGLTVARALRREMPAEQIVYFGDTARLPYGSKSPATVRQYVTQIINYLLPLRPKHVVMACNTATALALSAAVEAFPGIPISGVIEPGARAAVAAAGAKKQPIIGVLATDATVRSGAYERAILRRRQLARILIRPTPLLAPMVEEGRSCNDPLVKLALEQYLKPMVERGLDVLLLGCTHYPILRAAIEQVAGPKVLVIDSAQQSAQDVARRLRNAGMARAPRRSAEKAAVGSMRCYVSDDPDRFRLLAGRFLGEAIEPPTLVDPETLYRQVSAPMRLRPAV